MKAKIVLVVLIGITFLVIFWYRWSLGAIGRGPEKGVIIPEGATVSQIAQILEKEALIKSPLAFKIHVITSGLSQKLQAGHFSLAPTLTAAQIAQALTRGALDVWVTIPEGWRIEEISERLEAKIGLKKEEFSAAAQEGYMFPDTYLIPKKATATEVVKLMKDNFERRFTPLRASLSRTTLKESQVVVLASLVERETKFAQDRPKVAGVILKRLSLGIPLEIDATVQYALGYSQEEKTWWRKNLTEADLKTNSPYNTRKFAGLPPKPIANPGLASLESVISPLETDYLYYLSDHEGRIHYAKTLDEHIQNINRYL